MTLRGATGHNLGAAAGDGAGVDLRVPVGVFTCVTGVSGSGKSSLVLETFEPAVAAAHGQSREDAALPYASLDGAERVATVVGVDQSPLGRTSRGNPATYCGVWGVLRKRLAAEPLAKEREYKPGMFSSNVPGGRCEACKGQGAETVEMQFLADVTFSCPECGGRRFVGPVLDVRHLGLDVAEWLDLTVHEASDRLAEDDAAHCALEPMIEIGLGYLRLGQPLSTLSGGEAQRLKLAAALGGSAPGTLLVLDEPTAGLHPDDIAPLIASLDALVQRGDTVVVIEHDMTLAAHADHVIDLGPGAGAAGGIIVAEGTPEAVAASPRSATAPFLEAALEGRGPREAADARGGARGSRERSGRRSEARAIEVYGAREHNLRRVDIAIPRERLVVVTGPSGSGKSTLAFDVVHAEAQRRYLETLSPYARQYMTQLPRGAVDRVVGLPPSVSLEQRQTRGGGTSTVATMTEVAHYLRLAWARAGTMYCPRCDVPIAPRTARQIVEDLRASLPGGTRVVVLAPVLRAKKGIHRELLARARRDGFSQARIDGTLQAIEPGMKLERYREHDIDLVVAETTVDAEAIEAAIAGALERGDGAARLLLGAGETVEERLVSSRRACPSCGEGFPELDPRFFSFNTRQGRCEVCEGRGALLPSEATRKRGRKRRKSKRAPTEDPIPCEACDQTRLAPLPRAVRLAGLRIEDVLGLPVGEARERLDAIALEGRAQRIGETPLGEAARRLAFLEQVGLGYLGLARAADTLSGGETQRVRLAAQLGAGLTGVLYVLDEPTIGLHPRDTGRLLSALRALVDRGSSVLVVEHDADTIRAADHLIDVGPGGGHQGGRIVAEGAPDALLRAEGSVTGASLSRPPIVPARRPPPRRDARAEWLALRGARHHNLRDVDVSVPLGRFVVVTGVSGSGKSTLVREVLYRAVRDALGLVNDAPPGPFQSLDGAGALRRAVEIDQSPIGRTPRSVPATYVGIWNDIRKLLAGTAEARARGYGPARFSFNTEEGRCAECGGQGARNVEMAFLPDVLVPCEGCLGMRFDQETLAVTYHGRSAGELLALDVADAREVFSAVRRVAQPLELLDALGLGYIQLGQPSPTLSGGEAQRMKLVAELSAATSAGPTLYVMDEPTTGLHRDDVTRLISVLGRFVERGDTLVVIEHHPDVMLAADWIIDLGPEGGAGGGRVVAAGTPEDIAACEGSHTGAVLRDELARVAPAATRQSAE